MSKKFKDTTVGQLLFFAGILDSVETIPFTIHDNWNDTFEKVMMSVILAYFGGRTTEKASSMFKK